MKPAKYAGARPARGQPHYYEQIWELVRQCPAGRVTTYGALADAVTLGSARMAGFAMKRCFGAEPPVPAHRVVNRLGRLSGKLAFPTETAMSEALGREGVAVKDDRVVDFEQLFWDPAENT